MGHVKHDKKRMSSHETFSDVNSVVCLCVCCFEAMATRIRIWLVDPTEL